MSDHVMKGPYANAENAPLFVQKCLCPLNCPVHGENGLIPGDMSHETIRWDVINRGKKTDEMV